MDRNIKKAKLTSTFTTVAALSLLGLSHHALASNPTSGKLIIINSLGMVVNGSAADSASAVKIEVKDTTGICSTTATLAYGGVATVTWDAANVHSATKCTDIISVDVTALKTTSSGKVQYDSTANATPPTTATAATNFEAPTTPIANLVLIVTGNGGAAINAGSATATGWGATAGTAPVYSAVNGSIATTGVMSASATSGLNAATKMLQFGITPIVDENI
jgi:hypothetical protein